MKKQIRFVNFTNLPREQLLLILEKGNMASIREKMEHSDVISPESHLSFCEKLQNDKTRLYFAIFFESKLVGVANYQNINKQNKTFEPGIYFFAEDSIVRSHITLALAKIRIHYDLENPLIKVKKGNERALFFNTVKMGASIYQEDNEYYYLKGPSLYSKNENGKCYVDEYLKELELKYEIVTEF